METIRVTVDERGIALLEMNRPDVLNVLSVQLLTEMSAATNPDTGSENEITKGTVSCPTKVSGKPERTTVGWIS